VSWPEKIRKFELVSHTTNQDTARRWVMACGRPETNGCSTSDGDGQFDLHQIQKLLPLMRDHDVVVGFRISRRDAAGARLNGRLWTWL